MFSQRHGTHPHKAVITFEGLKAFRPFATIEEHDAELTRRWNAAIRPKDTIWHLGDFCFGPQNSRHHRSARRHQAPRAGHHDLDGYARKTVRPICGLLEVEEAILSYAHVHPVELTRWGLDTHGHLHGRRVRVDIGTPDERKFPSALNRLVSRC
jgi:calcineurin-like phosphoesterase family protein